MKIYQEHLPKKNVILCLSLLACGLRVMIPLLRFPFEKCFMNVDSTLSTSLVTCGITRWTSKMPVSCSTEVCMYQNLCSPVPIDVDSLDRVLRFSCLDIFMLSKSCGFIGIEKHRDLGIGDWCRCRDLILLMQNQNS